MEIIDDIATLEALYGQRNPLALAKVAPRITPLYARWIEASRFVVISTVGPEGTDGSPRGDVGPVVRIVDPSTLWLPDWSGNNRLDTLRNIIRDGRVSLMFMIPGSANVVRVNGRAKLATGDAVTCQFEHQGKRPRSVIVTSVAETYFQCAKAIMRSDLWTAEGPAVPTAGEFLREAQEGFDAETYDNGYPEYARERMW